MYPISTIFADYLKGFDHEFLVKASIAGENFDNTKIVDFQIESSIVSAEEFEIGTAIPSKLTIKLHTAEEIPANARVIPYLALSLAQMTWKEANVNWDDNAFPWIGGATEWMPLGEYFVDSRQKVNDVWVYTCYDKLVFGDSPYVSSLTYPATQKAVFNEICSLLGYTYDSSVIINPAYMVPVAPSGFSKRQVLAYISGANCGSFYWGKAGVLRMKRFAADDTPVFIHNTSDYIRAKQLNPPKSYSRIVVTYDTEDDLTYEAGSGDENNTLYMENPLATQAMVNALHASISGISYLPIEMDSRAFPQLDIGDKIGFGLYEGTSWMEAFSPWMDTEMPWTGYLQYETYILHSTFIFKGGVQLKLQAPSVSEQKSEFVVSGSLTEAVNNLDKTAIKEGKHYYGTTIDRYSGIKIQRDDGKSDLTLNSDVMDWRVDGQSRLFYDALANRIKFSGTLEAADGIFSGDLFAVGGTFTGTLVGVDGKFTGTIEGGSFIGGNIAIGSGDNIFKASDWGIWLGAQNSAKAPFSVDIAGHMIAEDAKFKGEISGSTISGGKITGALIRTALEGQRIELTTTGLRSYDSNGVKRVSIADDGLGNYAGIGFWSPSGNEVAGMYSDDSFSYLYATGPLQIFSFADRTRLSGDIEFTSPERVYGLRVASIDGLQSELNSKANASESGYNLVFDNTSRNLKLFSRTGGLLAQVNIPK